MPTPRVLPRAAGAAVLLGCFALAAPVTAQPGRQAAPIVIAPVLEQAARSDLTFLGTVHPARESIIGSAVDGRVIDVLVKAGDWVEAEAPLVQLRTDTLSIEIRAAEAELRSREARLVELEETHEHRVQQAAARRAGAEAIREYNQGRYDRTLALFERNRSLTQEDVDSARAELVNAEQTLVALDIAERLLTRRDEIVQAKAQVDVQKEIVAQLEDRLEKHTLRAPFNGYVVEQITEKGAWIKQGESAVRVAELDPVEVEAYVPELHIGTIRVGMPVEVAIDSIGGDPLPGTVARLIPRADARSRSFPVRIRVDNPAVDRSAELALIETASGEAEPAKDHGDGHLLKAGMLARVNYSAVYSRARRLVLKDALVVNNRGTHVVVVDLDAEGQSGTARIVPVEQGKAEGAHMEVTGNLRAGEMVVVQGNERLMPNQPVRVLSVVNPEE